MTSNTRQENLLSGALIIKFKEQSFATSSKGFRVTVYAFHGSLAKPWVLQRDAGIAEWQYVGLRLQDNWWHENNVYAGYSKGGGFIAHMAHEDVPIRAAILYESPIFPVWTSTPVPGDFPVLWIENNRGRRTKNNRRWSQMERFKSLWSVNHPMTCLTGVGRHIKINPLGHAWDQSLNPQILEWVNNLT